MQKLVKQISIDFPDIKIVAGAHPHWSPNTNSVAYAEQLDEKETAISLLHEVAHAKLGHKSYKLDIELLLMEVEAWGLAKKLAENYNLSIDQNKIEDCLDTYRDWLYRRGVCPVCTCAGVQQNSQLYLCFNCSSTWKVSASRFSRPYRTRQTRTNSNTKV